MIEGRTFRRPSDYIRSRVRLLYFELRYLCAVAFTALLFNKYNSLLLAWWQLYYETAPIELKKNTWSGLESYKHAVLGCTL